MKLIKKELQAIYDLIFMVTHNQEPTDKFKETLDEIHTKIGEYLIDDSNSKPKKSDNSSSKKDCSLICYNHQCPHYIRKEDKCWALKFWKNCPNKVSSPS